MIVKRVTGVREPNGVGVWKCIMRGWDGFAHHVCYEVGDGSKVLFWHDVCCKELPLKILCLELYNIVYDKDVWVDDNAREDSYL